MIITIARQCGCNGDEIGKALAQKYNLKLFDKKAISKMAKEKGYFERYPDFYGETPMDMLMHSITVSEEDSLLYSTAGKALKNVIDEDNFIIIGRCGNYVYRDDVKCISIFLSGSKKVREENIAKKHNISVRKAHNTVLQTDERRSKYHGYYTGEEWGMAGNYDLCINVDNLEVNELVEVIDSYISLFFINHLYYLFFTYGSVNITIYDFN